MNNKLTISPFVKWVGGKTQLLKEIEKRLPKNFNNYFEPFAGGGAVLFAFQPQKAFINDINPHLVNVYKIIQTQPQELIKTLNEWDSIETTKEKYFEMRNRYNQKILNNELDLESACLFIYLNKRSFNGLYRVNSKGLFNVPFNNKNFVKSFSEENILNISSYIKNISIQNDDFESFLKTASKGDFVFLDSPYAPLNNSSFESYTKDGFGKEDHIRLANLFKELHNRGCYLMLTNHNTDFINELYSDFKKEVVSVKRLINSDASKRTGEEVLITNY
ncbi:DNA adenine methylase [Mycoplasma procyoni]|uniref:DNA adenine methylase n=1 Tax=Mycoplasma procyoni TaxID=568784 RepID=UPI00197C5754|nr:DNA adenine methylase [Mycoplasma procyoni]MBN3534903.1 DNA adenine methylase [Mycoplasma procyoni]